MAKRMLIDATHPEETRVVVQSGHRLEEFDFESSTKKQVKGNIYLAKVTRVEPSLQAAFVDYGGNRHGFLAFSEIHPDYYRIPVSDRGAGEPEEHAASGRAPTENGADDSGVPLAAALPEPVAVPESSSEEDEPDAEAPAYGETRAGEADRETAADAPGIGETRPEAHEPGQPLTPELSPSLAPEHRAESVEWRPWEPYRPEPQAFERPEERQPAEHREQEARQQSGEGGTALAAPASTYPEHGHPEHQAPAHNPAQAAPEFAGGSETVALRAAEDSVVAADIGELLPAGDEVDYAHDRRGDIDADEFEPGEIERVELLGGDEVEEVEEADAERRRSHPMRHYKIQEVIKRRQIMLVQVSKEERGNKGAALTTYLSLAGRYCVLMPNTARGGGVSRKITSLSDRRRLKEILAELDIPEGMGVIVRTAGAERTKAEIKRDYEYLLRLWNEIRS
jgi:ribonuclease E